MVSPCANSRSCLSVPEILWHSCSQRVRKHSFFQNHIAGQPTAMLPKDGGQLPLKHRPITLFVLLWRVHAELDGSRFKVRRNPLCIGGVGVRGKVTQCLKSCFLSSSTLSKLRSMKRIPQFLVASWTTRSILIFSRVNSRWRFLQRTGWLSRVLALMRPLYAGLTRVLIIGSSFGEPSQSVAG